MRIFIVYADGAEHPEPLCSPRCRPHHLHSDESRCYDELKSKLERLQACKTVHGRANGKGGLGLESGKEGGLLRT